MDNETVKEVLEKDTQTSEVMIIWDMWEKPGSTNKNQYKSGYITKAEAIEKYGDFIYRGWYTSGYSELGGFKADIWADNPVPYLNLGCITLEGSEK